MSVNRLLSGNSLSTGLLLGVPEAPGSKKSSGPSWELPLSLREGADSLLLQAAVRIKERAEHGVQGLRPWL